MLCLNLQRLNRHGIDLLLDSLPVDQFFLQVVPPAEEDGLKLAAQVTLRRQLAFKVYNLIVLT